LYCDVNALASIRNKKNSIMSVATKGQIVGVLNSSQTIYAESFEDGKALFLTAKYDGGFVPKGKQLVAGSGFVFQNGFVVADFAAYPASADTDGFEIPATVAAAKPISWEAKEDSNGKTYFKKRLTTVDDTNGDGVIDSKDTARSANFLTPIIDWFGKNPIAIVGGVILLYLALKPKGKGKSKGFLANIL
jgi:hypothetical protein